ncbi:hypothetical protein [Paenibacillus oryzisoli]|uniref:Large polyvalent protein associated domain-containing protein n=1 Tax=Paenibacillus oryzisoli TaxID=1850517 RepID=A0A198ADS5_9BACL|nr:hypothetical protein [Paenibacillus oryzisoli]OAS19240.1 hypothetical protein A8708_26375 [Paenibacillus oryzisoli]
MVVRLKDLNNDSAPSTKKGVVRLSDLTTSNTYQTSRKPINGPVEMDDITGSLDRTARLENEYASKKKAAREIPVIGKALKGLDAAGEFIESNPVTHFITQTGRDIMSSGPAGAIGGLEGAATNVIGKYAPSLLVGSTIGKKAAGVAAREGLVGAPLGAAQTQAANPEASIGDVLIGAGIGAGGGAALGGLGTAAVKGLTRLADIQANKLAGNAISKATELPSRTVESPFMNGSPTNPVAQGYTENVGRTFGNRSVVRLSDLSRSSPASLEIPTAAVPDQPITPTSQELNQPVRTTGVSTPTQQGIRANYRTQLNNGEFSPELQSAIRNTDQRYDVQSNHASVDSANEAVKDITIAEAKFIGNKEFSAEHVATGYRLMQELDNMAKFEANPELKESLFERALNIGNKLAKDLTKAGQTSQAASVLSRLSPEGQLLKLVRTARNNGKEVSVADSVKFKELAAKVQEKSSAGVHSNQFNEILDRVERGEKVSSNDMINLANFLTRAENVVKPKTPIVRPPVVRQPRVPKEPSADDLPRELKQPKKREKVISFFDDAEQAALARIAARKNNLNSLPLPEWRDHTIVVASQLAKGTIKAATHVEDLVKLFGEEIRPVATQVYQSAQSMLKGVSRSAAEDKLERAQQALHKLSGKADEEKEAVKVMGDHVKKIIADAKAGKLNQSDVQKLRDYSDEITEMLADKKPSRIPTQEEKFLQSVKSLAKKIKEVETERIEPEQANREISNLIRQVTKITEGDVPRIKPDPALNKAISDIAHDVMNETRPTPKPTTLQEKIVEKFLKQKEKQGQSVSESDIANLRQLAKDATRLSSDQKIEADIAMQKILNSYEKSSAWDKLLAIRYMAMLLNSGTQAINAISGPIMASTGYVADILGTMVDISMNKVLKTPRTTTLYGTNPLKFMARYFKHGKTGGSAGFHGVNPSGIQSTNEIRGLAFKNPLNPFGLAERTLGAVAKGADYATYKSVFDSEIVKQGFLDAKNSGIKGRQDIQRHIENFVNNPPEEAILQADRIGKNTTFQRADTSGGKVANWLNSAPSIVKPVANTIFPFVRTPVNIASTAVTLTPAGIIKGLYQLTSKSQATQREAIRTLSLGLTGSAGIGSLGYYLQSIGVITGANDSGDKDVDSIREQAGKGKYRFNTSALERYLNAMFKGEGSEEAEKAAKYRKGDSAFDYNKLQPLAFPAAIGASLAENKDKPTLSRLGNAGLDAAGSLLGMSTLKGLQDAFQPQYGGTQGEKTTGIGYRLAESFFKSFSWSALAQEARRQDPIARKVSNNGNPVQDVKEYFMSRTPGLSQSLPPLKTSLGISKQNAPGVMGQYANPYKSEVAPYTEAAAIISDLIDRTGDKSLAPSAPEKKVTGKDRKGVSQTMAIPPDRYARLQEEVGNEIIKKVTALSPTLSDAKKADKIKDIYAAARENGRNKIKKEFGLR